MSLVIKGQKGGGGKGGGGGGTSRAAIEAPNTLQSNTIARVVDVVSEGEIVGLVDGLKSVYFDETPLQNTDGSMNFSGVKITERVGTPDQTYITGFPSIENEVPVGVEVLLGSPIVRTITDEDITSVRVKVQLPSLTQQNSTTGDLNGFSVQFQIDVRRFGGTFQPVTLDLINNPVTISGKTTSTYEASYRFRLPAGGAPWDVRVSRITANQDTLGANYQCRTFWSTYTQIIDNKIRYVDTACFGVEVDAQQFAQQVPGRSYEIYGIKVRVPTNYDPLTRAYSGIWNGQFKIEWSDNPAWVLYDLMTNSRYGLGESIGLSIPDKYALYTIAQYCDEMVDDGFGGMEPRYTFNTAITTREEAYQVLNAVASSFRGMIYPASGLITFTADSPSSPVKLVSPANVIGGDFEYRGSSMKSRHSVAVVRYNDPEDGYRSAVMLVEDREAIQVMGWKPTEVTAYGCTSKGQAYRYGKWILDNEKYSTEVVVYKAALDHADLRPGDIVSVADPNYAGIRYGGRAVEVTTTAITLDAPVALASGESFSLSIVMPDGTIEEKSIINSAGTHTIINLESALSDAPVLGAMWTITGTNVEPRQFRVISIIEQEKNIYEVTGLLHDPNKYARVEDGASLEDIPYSIIPSGPLTPPSNLSFKEYLYKLGSILKSAATISWTSSSDPRAAFYEVDVQRPETDYFASLGVTAGTSIDISDAPTGEYVFRIRAIDALNGKKSPYLTENKSLLGLLNEPDNVQLMKISNVGAQASLSWKANTDLDLSHYIIKYTSALSNPQWGAGTVLVERVPKEATSVIVPTLVGSYMMKAVDSSGKESLGIAFVSTNVLNIRQYNVVEQVEEHPTFSGTKTNVQVVSSSLKLIDRTQQGTYEFDNITDLNGVFTVRVVADVIAVGEDASETIDKWITLSSVASMTTVDPASWDVEVQIATTNDDPSDPSPAWSDWASFQIGDYTARGFKFRAILSSLNANTSPLITALGVTMDMEDRIEGGDDVTTSVGGLYNVVYTRDFKVSPVVGVSGQDMVQGDYYTITNKTATGFTVNFYDSNDVGVQRTFDWLAKGYGAEE